jgi:hypothetical protein
MGETLKIGTHLDIESELNLIKETRSELRDHCSTEIVERKTMKELGLKRSEINNILTHVYFVPLCNICCLCKLDTFVTYVSMHK